MKNDPWGVYLSDNWQVAAGFFLTTFVILIVSLVVQIEYRNGGWKHVLTLPRSYLDIFITKFIVVNLLIVSCFFMFNVFIVLSALLIELIQPSFDFPLHDIPFLTMISISSKMYVCVLAMMSVQFLLCLRFSNFILPIGIGLGLFTIGFMIRQWDYIEFYPYLYPFLVYFPNPGLPAGTAEHVVYNSVGWLLLSLVGGYWFFVTRTEKG